MKVYDASFAGFPSEPKGKPPLTVPVAANSLAHAARKASEVEEKHGELVKVELSDKILI